jgi:hypothetical protein
MKNTIATRGECKKKFALTIITDIHLSTG